MREHATIYGGTYDTAIVSVLSQSGRVLSPFTMEHEVMRIIAHNLNLDPIKPANIPPDAPLGLRAPYGDAITAEVLPDLFVTTMHFTLLVGVRTGPNSSSFTQVAGMREFPLQWVRVSDYRDTPRT